MKTLKDDANISYNLILQNKSPFSGPSNFRPISAANPRPNNTLKAYNSKIK
jgi:hypothetical protein